MNDKHVQLKYWSINKTGRTINTFSLKYWSKNKTGRTINTFSLKYWSINKTGRTINTFSLKYRSIQKTGRTINTFLKSIPYLLIRIIRIITSSLIVGTNYKILGQQETRNHDRFGISGWMYILLTFYWKLNF